MFICLKNSASYFFTVFISQSFILSAIIAPSCKLQNLCNIAFTAICFLLFFYYYFLYTFLYFFLSIVRMFVFFFSVTVMDVFIATNEIDSEENKKDPCAEAREECNMIRCPYGKEEFVDSQDCGRCRCVDPCRTQACPDDTKCAITLVGTEDGTEYRGVCRSGNWKPLYFLYYLY